MKIVRENISAVKNDVNTINSDKAAAAISFANTLEEESKDMVVANEATTARAPVTKATDNNNKRDLDSKSKLDLELDLELGLNQDVTEDLDFVMLNIDDLELTADELLLQENAAIDNLERGYGAGFEDITAKHDNQDSENHYDNDNDGDSTNENASLQQPLNHNVTFSHNNLSQEGSNLVTDNDVGQNNSYNNYNNNYNGEDFVVLNNHELLVEQQNQLELNGSQDFDLNLPQQDFELIMNDDLSGYNKLEYDFTLEHDAAMDNYLDLDLELGLGGELKTLDANTEVKDNHFVPKELNHNVFLATENNHSAAAPKSVMDLNIATSMDNLDEFMQELHGKMHYLIGNKVSSAKINVNPSELGPIQIDINWSNDAANITIDAKSNLTLQLLKDNSWQLTTNLHDNPALQLNLSFNDFQSTESHDEHQGQNNQNSTHHVDHITTEELLDNEAPTTVRRVSNRTLIDIKI